jgi:hypothetical protein
MRRQAPIATLLYNHIFPEPKQGDPQNFSTHLARNLVPEVRIEVNLYYGDLNSAEARYPGLNYCHRAHRMRLGRFPHHRRLFDAFDELRITDSEIQEFCNWEGTKSARERYEKDEGIKVLDTTGDEIGAYRDPREFNPQDRQNRRCSIIRKTEISVNVEDRNETGPRAETGDTSEEDVSDEEGGEEEDEEEGEEEAEEDEDEDDLDAAADSPETEHESATENAARLRHMAEVRERRNASVRRRMNQRIIAAWEQRQGHNLPPEIEQYLKEQPEQRIAEILHLLGSRPRSSSSSSFTPNSVASIAEASA